MTAELVLVDPTQLDDVPAAANLSDEFWHARPELCRIRQAAWAARLSADAVLGAVLARVAFYTPFQVMLPPTIGTAAPLNVIHNLVGPTATGKGQSMNVARQLVGDPPMLARSRMREEAPGSGEGLVRLFSGRVRAQDDAGNEIEVDGIAYDAVLIREDEVQKLLALGGRNGSTLLPFLRSAWSGERLAVTNASKDRQYPPVEAGSYRFVALIGVQPALAGVLLDDTAGGLPQRVEWFNVLDPALPDKRPPTPGTLEWEPIRWNDPRLEAANIYGLNRSLLRLDAAVVDDIDRAHVARVRGESDDPEQGHRMLARLKTAALLGLLAGRCDVSADDWQLAGIISTTSDAVRAMCRAASGRIEQQAHELRKARTVDTAVAARLAETATDARVRRIAGVVARHVWRAEDVASLGVLRSAVAYRDRDLFEAAVEQALLERTIVEVGDGYGKGPNRPEGLP